MLFFLLSHDDCYLGRMYEYLLLLVNFNIHMLTPMILQMALEVAGPFLVRKYPGPIRAIALQLADPNSSYNQKITSYFTAFEVLKEPYNQDSLLPELPQNNKDRMEITGAARMVEDIDKMREAAKQLLK
jgi:hypothetical protein